MINAAALYQELFLRASGEQVFIPCPEKVARNMRSSLYKYRKELLLSHEEDDQVLAVLAFGVALGICKKRDEEDPLQEGLLAEPYHTEAVRYLEAALGEPHVG